MESALARRGVEAWGATTGRTGAVVSLLSPGTRSMASDPGDLGWLDEVRSGPWLEGADWLFVSGYTLLRTPDPRRVVETAAVARAHGTRIALDLPSAAMVAEFGADRFSRPVPLDAAVGGVRHGRRVGRPARAAFGAGGSTVLVLKHGRGGASFVIDGRWTTGPRSRAPSWT